MKGEDGLRHLLDEVGARPPASEDPTIDGLCPAIVLEPGDEETLARALALCHEENMGVVPVGAGTRLGLGNVPSRLDVMLSTRGLRGVEDHIPGDFTVAVRAGTPLGELQSQLKRASQFLPVEAPGGPDATIGGIFALGEPGFRRRPGARPRDLLLGVEAVLADGTRVKSGGRVVKNVAGYELTKLLVGSAGTLAVMTRAFVRVRALPEEVVTVGSEFQRVSDAVEVFHEMRALPLQPEAVALLNPRHAREHGLGGWVLLARYEGLREETRAVAREANERAGAAIWDEIRDFPVGRRGDALVLRGQVVSSRTFELAGSWQDGGPLVAYPDGGLVYSRTDDPDALNDRVESARLLGGNVVVEQAPERIKKEIDVYGEVPDSFPLMKRIKERMDPKRILSPGRFVGRL